MTREGMSRAEKTSLLALVVVLVLASAALIASPADAPVGPWEEDTLPAELYDRVDRLGADLYPVDVAGHTGCWAAATPLETLILCPSGYRLVMGSGA